MTEKNETPAEHPAETPVLQEANISSARWNEWEKLIRENHYDAVILDPPRKGCDPKLLDFLASKAIPKIVYISCNPETLARDVAFLAKRGYGFSEIAPVDLFPRTAHVEAVVGLYLKEQK